MMHFAASAAVQDCSEGACTLEESAAAVQGCSFSLSPLFLRGPDLPSGDKSLMSVTPLLQNSSQQLDQELEGSTILVPSHQPV